mmetsp:Transcript_15297/g.17186  ORF Transcript_15297/g.17186 Transcript_15297/m.17186 type:complete len:83 (+) Transcript_15297:134-382(+)
MFAAIKQGVTVLGTTTSSCCITTSRVLRKLPTTTTPAPAPAPATSVEATTNDGVGSITKKIGGWFGGGSKKGQLPDRKATLY